MLRFVTIIFRKRQFCSLRNKYFCAFTRYYLNLHRILKPKFFSMKLISTLRKGLFCVAVLFSAQAALAQNVKFYGVKNTMRYDDGDDTKYEYLGWNAETGKAEFRGDVGLWSLDMAGSSVSSNLVYYDNLMYGNSGAVYINGYIYTVMSHEDPDADYDGVMEFVVRKWDAKTFEKVSEQRFPKSANLESRGMTYNPIDGKVYGLFYLTDVAITDPDYEPDQDDIEAGQTTDAGYALCTIDLETMQITQITPGVYYENFVTLACSPDGRLYSMISSGTMVEFDPATGLMAKQVIINDEGDEEWQDAYEPSGVVSQFKRQAACFDFNTGKMYWNGYVNSGKGYNDWGSYGPLSDRDWRTNGKYDTALYEVDVKTGKATLISKIPNRIAFSCLWVDGADGTDIIPTEPNHIEDINLADRAVKVYNAAGQLVGNDASVLSKGLYIIKQGNTTKKVMKN